MVVCLKRNLNDASLFMDLTPGNYYRVISISYDHFRIMSDDGVPGLYRSDLFNVVLQTRPDDWITVKDPDGKEMYQGPECLARPGFFEDWFDGKQPEYWVLRQRLSRWGDGEDYLVNSG